jgi:hypothetical protein
VSGRPGAGPAMLVAGACLLATAVAARAIEVQITTVRATAHGPSDAQLLELRPRLRRLVGYRSFRVLQKEQRECPWQSHQAFVLPTGHLFQVSPKAMRDEAVLMRVQILEGERALVDTDVRLQNRGVMLFGVDQDGQAVGEALIIMLKAVE